MKMHFAEMEMQLATYELVKARREVKAREAMNRKRQKPFYY